MHGCMVYELLIVHDERWGAGVETQKNVRGEIGGWGRVPFNVMHVMNMSCTFHIHVKCDIYVAMYIHNPHEFCHT